MQFPRQHLPLLQIFQRIALHIRRRRAQHRIRTSAQPQQVPRRHKSVAAVVPLAAQDHNAALRHIRIARADIFRHTSPGVFHQRQARYVRLLG
jgi:hypothetical protein